MISPSDIARAAAAALFAGWALYTEFRLRQSLESNANLKRLLDDKNIQKSVDSLSDTDLRNELTKDISGGDSS